MSPRFAWGGADRERALRDQASLEHLIALGERLQRDATVLLDRAAFDGDQIASATVEGDVRFADEPTRSAFMTEYLAMLGPLLKKYGSEARPALSGRVAVYPDGASS